MPQLPPLGDPHNAIELRIFFFSIEYVGKKEILFYNSF